MSARFTYEEAHFSSGWRNLFKFYVDMARKYVFDCKLPEGKFLNDLRKYADKTTIEGLYWRYYGMEWFNREQY